ncbi:sensor domain-containing diguanylate cyclase [Pseudobacillus sp. FSL P4-0506]|uniref:sensor domain-containing diguanylate cyclase n=1 Tax=Pseudobacillus sp. FSL P4-0506 TaxID=2921576 RepID=UPI0030F5AE22
MKVSFKHLILFVTLASVLFTLSVSLYSGYRLERETLVKNALETNRVYAEKLARTTEDYLKSTLQVLQNSAQTVAPSMKGNEEALLNEVNRLKSQSDMFNSVAVVDQTGKILAVSPEHLNLKDKLFSASGAVQALKEKKPLISKPFISITGRLIIMISYPIFSESEEYLGFVGGTIYLKERSILNQLLGEHFYHDGSYVYVVDGDGRVIYHQSPDRINDMVSKNPVVQKLMNGQSGAQRVTNTQGKDMIAGYAAIPVAEWGVVSQRPSSAVLSPSNKMIQRMLLTSLPPILISLVIIWWILIKITRPLQQLAYLAENCSDSRQPQDIKKIHAWYYKAIQLKKALLSGFHVLHERVSDFQQQSSTDPLTGLYNRRAMNEHLVQLAANKTPFSIILLDIDHFKVVNDVYGHMVGDEALVFLADFIKRTVREEDICCRYGGEEFLIILPNADLKLAKHIAEKLRSSLAETNSPTGKPLTLSAGVALFPDDAVVPNELIHLADQCLYEAKQAGRNKVIASHGKR